MFYFEEPILFVCLSENKKQRYLCLCSEVRSLQRWIISLIDIPTIVKLIQNEITVFDAFQSGEATKYIVLLYWWEKVEVMVYAKYLDFVEYSIL